MSSVAHAVHPEQWELLNVPYMALITLLGEQAVLAASQPWPLHAHPWSVRDEQRVLLSCSSRFASWQTMRDWLAAQTQRALSSSHVDFLRWLLPPEDYRPEPLEALLSGADEDALRLFILDCQERSFLWWDTSTFWPGAWCLVRQARAIAQWTGQEALAWQSDHQEQWYSYQALPLLTAKLVDELVGVTVASVTGEAVPRSELQELAGRSIEMLLEHATAAYWEAVELSPAVILQPDRERRWCAQRARILMGERVGVRPPTAERAPDR